MQNAQSAGGAVPEGDGGHVPRRGGRLLRRSTAGLVVLVLLAAAASYQFDLGSRWFGLGTPSPVTEPAQVLPPAGLSLPRARPAPPVARATTEGAVDPAAVRRVVAPLLRSKKLGPHVVVRVAQASDGHVVFRSGPGPVTPASTMKLLTTVAALQALGPDHRFTTKVVATPQSKRIVLVGGGDPLLARGGEAGSYPARADLGTLARATAKALRAIGRSSVRLGYDTSLFTGPKVSPHWEPSYVPDDVVSPITPLWVDEGRDHSGLGYRNRTPAVAAASAFAQALERHRITVVGPPVPTRAPSAGNGGAAIAQVRSAPLAEIVQHVVEVSDNEGAEVLARQVAIAEGIPASFAGGARAVRKVLRGLGISTAGDTTYDGSGLSRDDRLDPATLLAVLRASASPQHPGLRATVANLPVAGFSGSLTYRFDKGDPLGRGTVRAKTGTLTGVHGLAGTATSADGAVMTFVAIADRVKPLNTLDARVGIDRLAGALGGCTCAAR
jgi:D-alanyl-D-alanine carboxypeptidase/D-alanyl-D-alanine-endopeptidase (penicillin-binding protein 4)